MRVRPSSAGSAGVCSGTSTIGVMPRSERSIPRDVMLLMCADRPLGVTAGEDGNNPSSVASWPGLPFVEDVVRDDDVFFDNHGFEVNS